MTYKSIPSSNIVDISQSVIRSPKTFVMGGSLKTLTQLIKSIFATGEQGFAYDPNDLSTMFQDAAGTVPVTAVGQPIGLIRDKSGRNNHAFQTVSASRPILRQNATTGAYYLAFDGTNDSLRTNNIDFTATNKVSLFAGVRKMSDANAGVLLELSTSVANTGTFVITSPPNGSEPSYSAGSNLGLLTAPKTPVIFSAPRSDVLTMRATGNPSSISLRVNSTQAASSAVSHGAGNYGNHPLYIGRRAGTSLPFNGHLYSLIGIGRLTSDSETIALEKTIAKNTGVTLNV